MEQQAQLRDGKYFNKKINILLHYFKNQNGYFLLVYCQGYLNIEFC